MGIKRNSVLSGFCLLFLGFILFPNTSFAQKIVQDTTLFERDGRMFYKYVVEPGNTLYYISKQYDISIKEIQTAVENMDEVVNIHHVHIWTVGENDVHLEAHIDVADMMISKSNILGEQIEELLKSKFGINHITLQFECDQCKDVGLVVNGKH